jgi:hypothetical protein
VAAHALGLRDLPAGARSKGRSRGRTLGPCQSSTYKKKESGAAGNEPWR